MNRARVGIAVAALLIAAGCGGSGEDEPEAAETSPASQVSLADTCPKVQDALDTAFEGQGPLPDAAAYEQFAGELSTLVDEVDPKGEPVLTGLLDASRDMQAVRAADLRGSEFLDPNQAWLDAMGRVSDTCQQLGAPLS